jgi:hypothetical protein
MSPEPEVASPADIPESGARPNTQIVGPQLQPQTQRIPQGQGNLVLLNDGSKHFFPEGTTVDQMHKTLSIGPVKRDDNWVDKIRPFVAGGAGALAASATSLIPGVGETGIAQVAADTQGYSIVDSLMKYLGSNPPKSYSEALTDSEADAAINAVAGKLIGTAFKGVKGLFNVKQPDFYKLAPTTSQALEKYGMKSLATIPKFLENYGVPEAKAAALDKSGGIGFTQALAHANALNGRQATTNANPQKLYDSIKGQLQLGLDELPTSKYLEGTLHKASDEALNLLAQGSDHFKVLDSVIENPDKLSKVLKVGTFAGGPAMNVRQDLAAYKFMDVINKATTKDAKGATRIDPEVLGNLWNKPEAQSSLDLLYGKAGKDRITDFFKDIAYTQSDQAAASRVPLKYMGAGKFLLTMGTLAHAVTTGNYVAPAGIVGVQIGSSLVGRALTNPSTSRMFSELAKGGLKENPAFAAKVIGNAIRNQTVGLVSHDGKVQEGSFVENPKTGLLEFNKN